MIRLFAGITLPDEQRQQLAEIQSGIKDARWVAAESLHVTLRFIGEIDEDVAKRLSTNLGEVTSAPFELTLNELGTFGRPPYSVWAGVEDAPSGTLAHLQASIESVLVRAGEEPEGRKFSPHVTLARFRKSDNTASLAPYLKTHAGFALSPFTVNGFTLFESRLSHKGAHYAPYAEFDF